MFVTMILRIHFCVLLVTVSVVLCYEDTSEESTLYNDDSLPVLRDEYHHNRWRAVEIPQDHSGWVPSDETSSEESTEPPPPPKRRRVRKRKRRPQIFDPDSQEETFQFEARPRRRRPQRLDEFNANWRELEFESVARPYQRRRVTPLYRPQDDITNGETLSASIHFGNTDSSQQNENFDKNYEIAQINKGSDEDPIVPTTIVPNLKSLLKQKGSLSLSEILQQRNLSLADLIQGKTNAISALTEYPNKETTTDSSEELTTKSPKYGNGNRKKISSNVIKKIERYPERDIEVESTSYFTPPIQNYNRFGLLDDSTEDSTEKRIFVPSHPKYYTSFDYKPQIDDNLPSLWPTSPKITTYEIADTTIRYYTSTRPTIEKSSTSIKQLQNTQEISSTKLPTTNAGFRKSSIPLIKARLPITSAKINKSIKNPESVSENYPKVSILPENAFKIDLTQVFGLSEVLKSSDDKQNETIEKADILINGQHNKKVQKEFMPNTNINPIIAGKKEDGPFKMSIDIGPSSKDSTKFGEQSFHQLTTEPMVESTTKPIQEKLHNITAKEEILEILKDRESKDRLSRILKSRNMTIQELVAQRERGSSQKHLAEIFHNNTREPEPKQEEVFEGKINDEGLASTANFNRKPKSKFDFITPSTSTKFVEETSLKTNEPSPATENIFHVTRVSIKPLEGQATDDFNKPREHYSVTSFPTYKIEIDKNSNSQNPFPIPIWKTVYPGVYSEDYGVANKKREELSRIQEQIFRNEISRVDDIENTIADAVNEQLNVDLGDHHIEDSREEDENVFNIPNGVKSAILASLIIIGSSLLIFLSILVIFRWSQKTKTRFCYKSSFPSTKFKSPILNEGPRKALKSFVAETLGRKNICKSKQSMSDAFWETDVKPFQ